MTQENVNNLIRTIHIWKRLEEGFDPNAQELLDRYFQTNDVFGDLQVLDLTNWMSVNKRYSRLNALINFDTSVIQDENQKETVEQLQNALTVMFKYIEAPGAKINMGVNEPQHQMITSLTQVSLSDGNPVLSQSDVNDLLSLSLVRGAKIKEVPTTEDAQTALDIYTRKQAADAVRKAWEDKQMEEQEALNATYQAKFAEIDAYVKGETETLPAAPV